MIKINKIRKNNACHTNMSGVMAHSGFGGIEVTNSHGYVVYIPRKAITKNGSIKKIWARHLNDAAWLNRQFS